MKESSEMDNMRAAERTSLRTGLCMTVNGDKDNTMEKERALGLMGGSIPVSVDGAGVSSTGPTVWLGCASH